MWVTVPIALFGMLFFGPLLFIFMPPRRAVIALVLLGTMYLPNAGYQIPILRVFDKGSSTLFAVVLGVIIFDMGRLTRYRFHWVDIPMLLWCMSPFASSISNDLGPYDGLAEVMSSIISWGLPYAVGRLYITDRNGVRDLVFGFIFAGLVYLPLCLWEMKGGPFFHQKVYGFYPHNWFQQLKETGWRPSVFFMHGLWLCGFMAYAALCALCVSRTKSTSRKWIFWGAIALLGMVLKTGSNGAIAILAVAMMVIFAGKYRRWAYWVLILIPIAYTTTRIFGWDGQNIVEFYGGKKTGAGQSMETRRVLEDAIVRRALERPLFGWGGYGRSIEVETGRFGETAWTEAIWTKAIGERGLVGLWAWMLSGLLPAWLALRFVDCRRFLWLEDGTTFALILLVPLQMIYGLVVLDFSPYNPLCIGALASFALANFLASDDTNDYDVVEMSYSPDDSDVWIRDPVPGGEIGDDEMGGDAATAGSVERA
jgi:hypothetical protein